MQKWIIFYGFLLIGLVPHHVRAQQVNLLDDIEQAIDSHDREKVTHLYSEVTDKPEVFKNDGFNRFLKISHTLSASGYAEIVASQLEKYIRKNESGFLSADLSKSKILTEWGYAVFYSGQLIKSDSIFRITLLLQEISPDVPPLDIAYSCNFLGYIYQQLGNYVQAVDYFERAKKIRIKELGMNNPAVGRIYNNLGMVYDSMNELDKALANFEKAVEIKTESNDPSVYNNYINIGVLLSRYGSYSQAIEYYKKAETVLLTLDEQEKLADLYVNLGVACYMLKANQEAFRYYSEALKIYTDLLGPENGKTGKVFQNLANVYDELGDQVNEQKANEKAIAIAETNFGKQSPEVAPLYNNLGMFYRNNKNYLKALEYLYQATVIYRRPENQQPEKYLNTLSNIAETFEIMNEPDSALFYFTETVQHQQQLYNGRHPYLAFSFNNLAKIYLKKKDIAKASDCVQQALTANSSGKTNIKTIGEACLDPGYFFDSYLLLGAISGENKLPVNEVLQNFYLADSILSGQRNFLFDKSDKINLARNSKLLAAAVLGYLWQQKDNLRKQDIETAFNFVEKSKNLVLLQSVSVNQGKSFASVPDSVLRNEEAILGQINYFVHQEELETDSIQKSYWEGKVFALKLRHKKLLEFMESNYPDYYNLKYREDIPKIAEIQLQLDKQTAILGYFAGDSSLYRFTITRNNTEFTRIPTENLDDALTGMRKGITLGLNRIYLEKARQLYTVLIPHVLPSEIKNLVIVPDGNLAVLPFEALLQKNVNGDLSSEKWPFLLNRFTVSYSPSFSLWMKFRESPATEPNTGRLLAFAPVFASQGPVAMAKSGSSGVSDEWVYKTNLNDFGLAPLEDSESEILNVDTVFHRHALASDMYLFSDASEKNFSNLHLDRYNFIHIATHGFVDKSNPDLSGLFFAPMNDSDYDNILYTGEIYNLKINAELVTLSACETGMGKIAEGEGLLGFSRAFLFAGAKNLLLSLWKVDDASTSQLMSSFYSNHLEKEMPLAESLAQAKKHLIHETKFSHPYFWAPFVLIGK